MLEFALWTKFRTDDSKPCYLMARWGVVLACEQTEMRIVCVGIIKDVVWSKDGL